MGMKILEKLVAIPGEHSLVSYDDTAATHNWESGRKTMPVAKKELQAGLKTWAGK